MLAASSSEIAFQHRELGLQVQILECLRRELRIEDAQDLETFVGIEQGDDLSQVGGEPAVDDLAQRGFVARLDQLSDLGKHQLAEHRITASRLEWEPQTRIGAEIEQQWSLLDPPTGTIPGAAARCRSGDLQPGRDRYGRCGNSPQGRWTPAAGRHDHENPGISGRSSVSWPGHVHGPAFLPFRTHPGRRTLGPRSRTCSTTADFEHGLAGWNPFWSRRALCRHAR